MSRMTELIDRGRGRLGRDLQRVGRRVAGRTGRPATPAPRQPGPTGTPEDRSSSPGPTKTRFERIDPDLYLRDPDPERAAAILDGAFGHGYLLRIGPDVSLPGFLADWEIDRLGPLTLHCAPRTVATSASVGDGPRRAAVLLLGHPLDVDRGTADRTVITDRLLATLRDAGPDALVREAAYLAGRWTLVAVAGEEVTVLPDAMATQPVLYRPAGDGLTLASSEILVALAHDLPPSAAEATAVARAKRLRQGVVHSPGVLTAVEEVLPLLPNCLLRADLTAPGIVRHERFWPFEPRTEDTDMGRVHGAFAERMRDHVRLIGELGPRWWSLTGGRDSRVSLAHLDLSSPPPARAFTYLNPRDLTRSADVANDLFLPSLLAANLEIPHRVLRWRQAEEGSVFDRLHRATYPLRRASHGAAHAMWADLPRDIVEVQSIGGEVGTVFFAQREEQTISPELLVRMWAGRRGGSEPSFPPIFADYIDYTQFSKDRLGGYDHHDVFYWEHRMGRWAHRKYLDGDFSHRLMMPFNDRRLLEIMHRSPVEQRTSKLLYDHVLRDRPDLEVEFYRR